MMFYIELQTSNSIPDLPPDLPGHVHQLRHDQCPSGIEASGERVNVLIGTPNHWG